MPNQHTKLKQHKFVFKKIYVNLKNKYFDKYQFKCSNNLINESFQH